MIQFGPPAYDAVSDRSHLAIERVPGLTITAARIKQQFRDALIEHSRYVRERGEDMAQIRNWTWPCGKDADAANSD
jgi:xylulose-5-phosphate/fructose-6-phosphate phosphoketolase